MMNMIANENLIGRFFASLQDVVCEIELWLDRTGCLSGTFSADNERLEVIGGVPNAMGEFFGLIREPGGDTLAVFRAHPEANDLLLEVDAPNSDELMRLSSAERVIFHRMT